MNYNLKDNKLPIFLTSLTCYWRSAFFLPTVFCFHLFGFFLSFQLQAQNRFSEEYKLYTQADGLSSDITNSPIEDKNGIIWIGTQKGITRFDGKFNKLAFIKVLSLGYFDLKNKCK